MAGKENSENSFTTYQERTAIPYQKLITKSEIIEFLQNVQSPNP